MLKPAILRFVAPVAILMLTSAVACDGGFMVSGPVEICSESGVQCVLGGGPLGVCERASCDEGLFENSAASRACFQCTPQH